MLELYQPGASQPPIPSSWLPGDLMTRDTGMARNPRNGMAASLQIHPGNMSKMRTLDPMLGLVVMVGEIR